MAQCEYCGRCFARNEHLIRHQRIHTGERPFHCPHCKAGFQRPDVLAKHMEKLHRQHDGSAAVHQVIEKQGNPRDRERSRLACDQCRKRKLKCDNVRPCRSCQTKKLACTVSSSSRPPGRPRNSETGPVSPTDQYASSGHSANQGLGSFTGATEDVDASMVDPLLGQWTPDSMEPPPTLVTVGTLTTEASSANSNMAGNGIFYGNMGSAVQSTEQWLHGPEVGGIPSLQAPFDAATAYLQQTWETMDFLDDLVPSSDFGHWLDDLNDFSMSGVYDIWPQASTAIETSTNTSMDGAIDMMKDQLQRRSRASSPSREAQRWSWYSAQPQLGAYDDEIINVLLNVANRHIASTFAIFGDFEAGPKTRVELALAMAAVGGLYCTAPDSPRIAKMLFNDARRLMLEEYLQHNTHSFDDYLSFAKTFILLEVYGLCSGDKRAYEFMEVFHGSKVHAASSCIKALAKDAPVCQLTQARLLREAMHVLDSYRVLLLQRPPSFVEDAELPIAETSRSECMCHLASVIRYCWMASPRDADPCSSPRLWKAEFVQLALDCWVQSNHNADGSITHDVPHMLLYHLAQVSLHSNMGVLHRLAQAASQSCSRSNAGKALGGGVQPWNSERQYGIAVWHARALLRIASEGLIPPPRRPTFPSGEKERGQIIEPPHLPLSVYFASLVVWFGEVMTGDASAGAGDEAIEAGSQLLFKLRVPMANFLGNALCELLSTAVKEPSPQDEKGSLDTTHVPDGSGQVSDVAPA